MSSSVSICSESVSMSRCDVLVHLFPALPVLDPLGEVVESLLFLVEDLNEDVMRRVQGFHSFLDSLPSLLVHLCPPVLRYIL